MVVVAYFLIWFQNWGKGLYLMSENSVPRHEVASNQYGLHGDKDTKDATWHSIDRASSQIWGERCWLFLMTLLNSGKQGWRWGLAGEREGPQARLALSSKDQHHFEPFGIERKPCVMSVVQSLVKERDQFCERVFKGILCCGYGNNQVVFLLPKGFLCPGSKAPLFLILL